MATTTKKKTASGDKVERKRFTTTPFVISYPSLFSAKQSEDGDGKQKFGCAAIWTPAKFTEKDKVLWSKIMGEIKRIAREKFGKEWKDLPDNVRRGMRDGSAKEGTEGYGEGKRFASLNSTVRPGVVGPPPDKDAIGPDHDNADLIYPGAICRATISIYSYGGKGDPKNKGKGIAFGLFNVQKLKDGPRIDNRVNAEDDFDEDVDAEWLDEEDADDMDGGDEDGDEDEDEFG